MHNNSPITVDRRTVQSNFYSDCEIIGIYLDMQEQKLVIQEFAGLSVKLMAGESDGNNLPANHLKSCNAMVNFLPSLRVLGVTR